MRHRKRARVFLKPCHGSSASGIVAIETSRGRIQAFSTVQIAERDGTAALWNSRPGRWYRELPELIRLIDEVCRHRAQAQVWLPKMGWSGRTIDFRVVTIAGEPMHAVLRMSKTPMTNLLLRNERGDIEAFERQHDPLVQMVREQAQRAAACFPQCLALGVDVAVTPRGRAFVLEANAFGDLLPGCLHSGWDTYRWQLEKWRQLYVSAIG